jgi:hypothetical protein
MPQLHLQRAQASWSFALLPGMARWLSIYVYLRCMYIHVPERPAVKSKQSGKSSANSAGRAFGTTVRAAPRSSENLKQGRCS